MLQTLAHLRVVCNSIGKFSWANKFWDRSHWSNWCFVNHDFHHFVLEFLKNFLAGRDFIGDRRDDGSNIPVTQHFINIHYKWNMNINKLSFLTWAYRCGDGSGGTIGGGGNRGRFWSNRLWQCNYFPLESNGKLEQDFFAFDHVIGNPSLWIHLRAAFNFRLLVVQLVLARVDQEESTTVLFTLKLDCSFTACLFLKEICEH